MYYVEELNFGFKKTKTKSLHSKQLTAKGGIRTHGLRFTRADLRVISISPD